MNFNIFNDLFSNIWAIFLVILAFGGSIFVHELGHFLAARKRGLKVERFSIGFGPKLFSWKKGGVEYRISLLPLGGYVALPQLADLGAVEGESQEKGKPLPKISYCDKMIVAVMGAVFNLIFAFVLATLLWAIGQPSSKEQLTTTIGYVPEKINIDLKTEVPGPAYEAGLMPGDQILKVDGDSVSSFQDIQQLIVTGSGRSKENKPEVTFTIKRGEQIMDVPVFPRLVQFNIVSNDKMRSVGIAPEQYLLVGEVYPGSPAEKSGIKKGDVLLAANGKPLYSLNMLSDILNEHSNEVELTVQRGQEKLTFDLKAEQVPYTKPLGLLSAGSKNNDISSLKFLPKYDEAEGIDLTSPKAPSQLSVFEKSEDSLFDMVKIGDQLVAINGKNIESLQGFKNAITDGSENVSLDFERLSTPYTLKLDNSKVTAKILPPRTHALVGIKLESKPLVIHIDPISQFSDNLELTFHTLGSLFSSGSNVGLSNLMGPPGILRTLHTFSSQDFRLLIWFVVLLNINLAILNLLPIPVLDGGIMTFATIGKLRGKELPSKFIAISQGLFIFLLFSLMIYVSFFDVRRWQGDRELEDYIKQQKSLYVPTKFNAE